MARPPTSNLSTLFAFIQGQVPPGGIGGDGPQYRNLEQYYIDKKLGNADPDDTKVMADRALNVCGLVTHAAVPGAISTLNQPANHKLRAIAATLLAMSLIRDTDTPELTNHFGRLQRQGIPATLAELKKLLTHGDVKVGRNAKITLKNFTSAGTQKVRFMNEAEDAYTRAYTLMTNCRMKFILHNGDLPPMIAAAFNLYFGDPNAVINTAVTPIPFDPAPTRDAVRPNFAIPASARAVVRDVLRRICDVFLSPEPVKITFGGRAIDTGTYAYVTGKRNPTHIHLGGMFFGKPTTGIGTMGGTIVHELSHTWAATLDHVYRELPSQALAAGTPAQRLQALSNADNYKFFVETAFAP